MWREFLLRDRFPLGGAAVAALVLLSTFGQGCVHDGYSFRSARVHQAAPELHEHGTAEVRQDVSGEPMRLSVDDEVVVRNLGALGSERIRLGDLIAHCTDPAQDRAADMTLAPEQPRCPLLEDDFIHHDRLDVGATVLSVGGTALALASTVGVGVCALACDEPWNIASAVALGTAVAGILVGIVVVLLSEGFPVPD